MARAYFSLPPATIPPLLLHQVTAPSIQPHMPAAGSLHHHPTLSSAFHPPWPVSDRIHCSHISTPATTTIIGTATTIIPVSRPYRRQGLLLLSPGPIPSTSPIYPPRWSASRRVPRPTTWVRLQFRTPIIRTSIGTALTPTCCHRMEPLPDICRQSFRKMWVKEDSNNLSELWKIRTYVDSFNLQDIDVIHWLFLY